MPLGTARSTPSTALVFPKALSRPEPSIASADRESDAASQDAVLCMLIAGSLRVGLPRLGPRPQRAVSMPPRRRCVVGSWLGNPGGAGAAGSTACACGSNLLHRGPACRVSERVGAAYLQQLQAQVADLGEQAVQGRLVGDRPGDDGVAALVAGHPQAVEPGRPAAVQNALDADFVVDRRLRPSSPPRGGSGGQQAMAASAMA